MIKNKKWYFIEYWDKMGNIKSTTIKAKSEMDAENKLYKKNRYSLVRKISLI